MAQIVTSARAWPSRAENAGRRRAEADRGVRSREFYLLAALVFAVLTYLAVALIRAGATALLVAAHPENPAAADTGTWVAHASSLVVWISACLVVSLFVHRYQSSLDSTLTAAHRRGEKLALVSEVSGTLSGPLPASEIAVKFLQKVRATCPDTTTAAVFLHDEMTLMFKGLAANGPLEGELASATFPLSALPEAIANPIVKGTPAVAYDLIVDPASVGGRDEWAMFCDRLPAIQGARSLVLLPLRSRNHLIGLLMMRDDRAREVDVEPLQVLTVLTHFLAGALDNALSVAEAEERAERAALISRVAQHAPASLDDHAVLNETLEELGTAMKVGSVIVQLGKSPEDLRVAYEWGAHGVAPAGIGSRVQHPAGTLAVRDNCTVAIADVWNDPRLDDPDLGRREDHLHGGFRSALATPISLGGRLVGVLLLQAGDKRREWSGHEVRLVEGVARELRVTLETARLLEARVRESDRLLALHRASTELATHTDSNTVIQSILRNAVTLLGGGSGSFFRWDAEAGVLRRVQSWQSPELEGASEVRPGEGLAGVAFAQARPLIVNDYQSWDLAGRRNRDRGLRAGLGVPLGPAGKPLGVLLVSSYDESTQFSEDDARLLELFGDQAAAALMTAEAFEEQGKAVAELERLNTVKSEFVAIVSHEFRTPLTGIQGFSEMMRDEDLTVSEMREYATDINKDARRLNRLVGEMLDLSRMESGRMVLNLESVDLNAIVEDVVATMQPSASKHRFVLELDRSLPSITADRDKICQVVTNLANNAVKYAPDGGDVTITTHTEGNLVRLTVSDKGVGMPPEMLEQVFEPYSRVESGPTRSIRGTGLGLPIARQLLKLHGGRIWAESVEGQGSTFHCLIPVGPKPRGE